MSDEPAEDSPPQKPGVEEPAEESTRPCAPREPAPPRKPRAPRVKKEPTTEAAPRKPRMKKEPVEAATPEPADPMLFAGLNDTMKKMVQAERRHRLSNLKFV